MDVLRPQIINVGGRCYRRNPTLNRDVDAEEIEEYDIDEDVQKCGWEDDVCDTPIEETDNGYQLKVDIPSVLFKHIIGRKGETRRRLETETRTQIKIPKAGIEGPIVIAGHDRKGIISAKTRIDVIVDSARVREPFTHFLSIPVTASHIQTSFHDFKTDVLRECDGDHGLDATIFQKPEKLHLTIGTLVLLSQAEVNKAVDLLQKCHEDLIIPILKEVPLKVKIKGLEYMNDDPNNVDVLYAMVQPGGEMEKLQLFIDRVVDKFVSTGLMKREYDHVKLHITVMNTLMRKDPTGTSEPQQRQNREFKEREAFDASNVIKRFGQFDFGELHVNTIHLSQRQGFCKDGYYMCSGSVSLP